MKRQQYRATLWSVNEQISEGIAYAHNSGVRKSEALARDYARAHGIMLHGSKPNRDESGYARIWRSEDGTHEVIASVVRVP
jgi:hypothetical protein